MANRENGTTKEKVKLTPKQTAVQVVKFVFFSAGAGIIQFVTFTLLNEVFKLEYMFCYLTALILSVLYNFTFNRKFTFKSAANIPIAMLKVALFYCVFTPLSTWWGTALTDAGVQEYIVLAGTMIINLVSEYLYCRFVVYRKSMNTNASALKQAQEEEKKNSAQTGAENDNK